MDSDEGLIRQCLALLELVLFRTGSLSPYLLLFPTFSSAYIDTTPTEWHVVHCIFYWRKQIRARHTGVTVEPRYNSEGHTHHCGAVFRERGDPGVMAGVALKSDGGKPSRE